MSGKVEAKTTSARVDQTSADLFDFGEAGALSGADLHICRIIPVAPVRPEDVLILVGRARWPGNPPIARAIAAALAERGLPLTELTDGHSQDVERWHPIPRQGIDGRVGEFDVLIGTADFLEDAGIPIPEAIRTLLADHQLQEWRPVLVGACRHGLGSHNARRSLIGLLAIEVRSSASGSGCLQAVGRLRPDALVIGRSRALVSVTWHRVVHHIAGLFTRRGLCILGLISVSALAGLWCSALTIRAGDLAVVQRFGRSVTLLGPGLHIRPWWPVETVTRIQPRVVQTIAAGLALSASPADAEQPAGELMWTGDVWPPESASSQTADFGPSRSVPQLLRVQARVQYGIADSTAFLFNARDVDALVASLADSVLRALIGARSASFCLGPGRATIADRAAQLLQEKLDAMQCGIAVDAVLLDELQPCEGGFDLQSRDRVSDRIETAITSVIDSDRLLADARRRSLDILSAAEKDRDSHVREARNLFDQVQAHADAFARDAEATRRRLLMDLAGELPGGLPQLRQLLAEIVNSGRRPATTQEGGSR